MLVCILVLVLSLGLPSSLFLGASASAPGSSQPSVPQPPTNATVAPPGPAHTGTPLPPGTSQSTFALITSKIPMRDLPPRLVRTGSGYEYVTGAGNYTFLSTAPYVMSYSTTDGSQVVPWSAFLVGVSTGGLATPMMPTDIAVTQADNYTFAVAYTPAYLGVPQGRVLVRSLFSAYAPPTFEVNFTRSQSSRIPFNILWALAGTPPYLQAGDGRIVHLTSYAGDTWTASQNNTVTLGYSSNPSSWQTTLGVDWSDAGAGDLYVGPMSAFHIGLGAGLIVEFPTDQASVDPSLGASTTSGSPTGYPSERKTFFWDGFYWAFYDTGSQVAADSSPDGNTWVSEVVPYTGTINRGFDVAERGPEVALAWVDSGLTGLYVTTGVLAKGYVNWNVFPVAMPSEGSMSYAGVGPVSVAIGTDGNVWVSAAWAYSTGSPPTYEDFIFESYDSSASQFVLADSYPANSQNAMAILIPQPSGRMFALATDSASSNFCWFRWSLGAWGSTHCSPTQIPTGSDYYAKVSAAATSDGAVYVSLPTTSYGVDVFSVSPSDVSSETQAASGTGSYPASYPTLGVDNFDGLYLFWEQGTGAGWDINYAVRTPATNQWPSQVLYQSSLQNSLSGLTAAAEVSNTAPMLFKQNYGTSASYVYFMALPLPTDLGGAASQPWSRSGLAPYGTYFQELSEYVGTGNGLLTIVQTDVNLPGRGLDLAVSRVFTTPRSFLTTSGSPQPYLFENYGGANLGLGWQLNFPWVGKYYLHLSNGQAYVLQFNSKGVFENHAGEQFTLTEFACGTNTCYTLVQSDGTTYQFNANGLPTSETDFTGQNTIGFAYAGPLGQLSTITDAVGRTVTFSYNPYNQLQSLSWAGRSVQYVYDSTGASAHLVKVLDPLARATTFTYSTSNAWLVTGVTYPTGGQTTYSYISESLGEATAYLVSLQNVYNGTPLVKSTSFSPDFINGRVAYEKVTIQNGSAVQGYTVYNFDSPTTGMTVTVFDASGHQMRRVVTWYNASGEPVQTDTYSGNVTAKTSSTFEAFDNWGNVIYTRDAAGQEAYTSYANTDHANVFYTPGLLTQTSNGRIMSANFDNRSLNGWSPHYAGGSTGWVGLGSSADPLHDLSMEIATNVSSNTVSSAQRYFPTQSGTFVAEGRIRTDPNGHQVFFVLMSSTGAYAVYFAFRDGSTMGWSADGQTYTTCGSYIQGAWYLVAFEVNVQAGTYNIWINGGINGSPNCSGATLRSGTAPISSLIVQAGYIRDPAPIVAWCNDFRVYTQGVMTISGVPPRTEVEAVDAATGGIDRATIVPTGPSTLTFNTLSVGSQNYFLRFYNATQAIFDGSMESGTGWTFFTNSAGSVFTKATWNDPHTGSNSYLIAPWGTFSLNNYAEIKQDVSGFSPGDTVRLWFKVAPYSGSPGGCTASPGPGYVTVKLSVTPSGSDSNPTDIASATIDVYPATIPTGLPWIQLAGVVSSSSFRLHAQVISDAQLTSCNLAFSFDDIDGGPEYVSPTTDFWGGDAYTYTFPQWRGGEFYGGAVPASIHNRVLGTLSWQNGSQDPALYLDMSTYQTPSRTDLLRDMSGHGNAAAVSGTVATTGIAGGAQSFGGSAYLTVPDSTSLDSNTFSVSFWINPSSFPSAYTRIFAKDNYNSPAGTYRGWIILYDGLSPLGRVYLAVFGSGSSFQEWDSPLVQLTQGVWQHLAFTFDGVYLRAYLNGVQVAPAGTLSGGSFGLSTNTLYIGTGDASGDIQGILDEVRIYGRALSAGEVQQLATQVLWFDMETFSSATALADLSGFQNVGSTSGVTLSTGEVGHALSFSGSSYVLVPSPMGGFPSGSLTLTAWVKGTGVVFDEQGSGAPSSGWHDSQMEILSAGTVMMSVWPYTTKLNCGTITTTAWHFLALTYDSSTNALTCYVDGSSKGSATFTRSVSGASTYVIGIGDTTNLGSGAYFTGSIDEVHIYRRALAPSEISTFNSARSTPPSRSFTHYNAVGEPIETKTYHNASWLYSERAFDPFGNVIYQSNPDGQVTYTGYSPQYDYAYPTSGERFLAPLDDMETPGLWTTTISTPSGNAGYYFGGYSTAQYTSPYHSLYVYIAGGAMSYDWGSVVNGKNFTGSRVTDLRTSYYIDSEYSDGSTWDSMDAGVRMRLYDASGNNYATYEYWLASWYHGAYSRTPPWNARLVNQGIPPMNGWLVLDVNPNNDWTNISWSNAATVRIELFVSAAGTYGDTFRMYFDDVGVNAPSVTTSGTYDFNTGLVTSKTDPRGFTTSYSYDLLGRVTQIAQPQVNGAIPVTTYVYDDAHDIVTTYDPDSLPRALHFDMETTLNGAMEDLSGYGGMGTIYGTTSVAGQVGLARSFNGASDYVQVPKAFVQNGGTATYAAWFRTSSDGVILGEQNAAVGGAPNSYDPILYVQTNGHLHAGVYDGGCPNLVSSTTVNDGKWHFAALVISGGNTQTLYLDGVQVGSPVTASIVVGSSYTTVGTGYTGGCWPYAPTAWFYLNGAVDEVQVFGTALSSSTISSIYQGTEGGRYVKTYYDGLGRQVRAIQRSFFSGPSTSTYHQETYTDNWQDQVATYVNANGSTYRTAYDYLGRPTTATNPDGSTRTTSYDDINRIVTMVDEVQRETQDVYDVAGRLVSVRQYTSGSSYVATTNAYDLAGELVAVTDPIGQATRHVYDDAGRLVQTLYPDGTTEAYTFDNVGNLIAKTDRSGRTIRYTYDGLNRLSTAVYPGGATLKYTYDPDGDVVSVQNGTANLWFGYDALGRMTSRSLVISGDPTNYTTSYGYDLAGNLLTMAYPDGQGTLTYAYDAFYRVASVTFGTTTLASFSYRKDDLPSTIAYGDGSSASYVFNGRGFPLEIKVTVGSTSVMDLAYTENAAGDITGLTNKAVSGDTESYGYDNLDRLTTASGPWGTLGYTYDNAGNRLTMTLSTTTYYAYGAYNELCAAGTTSGLTCTTSGATTYTYDGNGNMITRSSPSTTSTFDLENRLVTAVTSAGTYTFAYDGLGDRIRETGPQGSQTYTNTYVASGDQTLYVKNVVGSTTTKTVYLYAGSLLIASVSGTTTSYFHEDHLGSTRLVTQAGKKGATVVFSTNYEPFGVQYAASGTNPSIKYTGQWDEALGLYWNHARFYDPTLGRFVSADPGLGHMSSPQTLDRYVYAVNNPERFQDPSGRDCSLAPWTWGDCLSAAGNAVVSGATALGNALSSAGQAVSNWWNGLDPNVRTAIIFGALTVAVILTAGALAPAAVGAVAAMETTALAAGAVGAISTGAYVAGAVINHQQVTWSGALAAFTKGAFLGALGAVAGPLANAIAEPLGLGSTAAAFLEGAITVEGAAGADILQGNRNPTTLAEDSALALLGSGMGDEFFPTEGFTPAGNVVANGVVGELVGDVPGIVGPAVISAWNSWEKFNEDHPGWYTY